MFVVEETDDIKSPCWPGVHVIIDDDCNILIKRGIEPIEWRDRRAYDQIEKGVDRGVFYAPALSLVTHRSLFRGKKT